MKKFFKLIFIFSCMTITGIHAQVGMSTNNPNKDAVLDLNMGDGKSEKGLLLPKVALKAINSVEPMTAHTSGMHVWNTATDGAGVNAVTPGEYYNDGAKWVRVSSSADAVNNWQLNGNTNGAIKTIGTKDNFDLPFITNNSEKMRLTADGRLGIGTDTPLVGFHLKSSDKDNNDLMIEGVDDGATFIIKRATTSTLPTGQSLGGLIWTDVDPAPGIAALTRINSNFRGPDLSSLHFFVNRSTVAQMTLSEKGFLGIGKTPGSKLHLYNDNISDADDDIRIETRSNTYTPSFTIDRTRTDGANLISNDIIGTINFRTLVGAASSPSNMSYLRAFYKGDGTNNSSSLTLGTSNVDRMTIDEDGYVGIGTKNPNYGLHMVSDNRGYNAANIVSAQYSPNIGDGAQIVADRSRGTLSSPSNIVSGDGLGSFGFRGQIGGSMQPLSRISSYYRGGTLSDLIFATSNATKMIIDQSGNVGIGTTAPAQKLDVNGLIKSTGALVISDARYKTNIETLQKPLEILNRLRGTSYEMNTKQFPDKGFVEGKQYGVIAQEVEKILPDLVTTGSDGYKAVNYQGFIPVLIEAVKAQQTQIENQKRELTAKEKEIKELKARMDKLEKAVNSLVK